MSLVVSQCGGPGGRLAVYTSSRDTSIRSWELGVSAYRVVGLGGLLGVGNESSDCQGPKLKKKKT